MGIRFQAGSIAETILLHIALCGEFPKSALDMLGNRKMIVREVTHLKKEGFIKGIGNRQLSSLRLTQKGIAKLEELNPKYKDHYMETTNNHSFPGMKRDNSPGSKAVWRTHRIAEVICCLEAIGTKIWKSDKPKLHLDYGNKERKKEISTTDLIFYNGREIKSVDINQRYKIDFTRILGVLFSAGGIYSIYNTNYGLIKWNSQGEGKAQILINDIIRYNYNTKAPQEVNDAIIFVKEFDHAADIFNSNGGLRDSKGFELLSLDNSYGNIYIVPLGLQGLIQLKMLTTKNWHQKLKENLFEEEYINFNYSTIDCDAMVDNSYYIMTFFDGNISRLSRLREAMYDISPDNFEVICFDWQVEALRNTLPEGVHIKTASESDILNIILKEGEG